MKRIFCWLLPSVDQATEIKAHYLGHTILLLLYRRRPGILGKHVMSFPDVAP
jgi:hypothetical protein